MSLRAPPSDLSRRTILKTGLVATGLSTAGLALAACGADQPAEAATGPVQSLKTLVPFPIGAAVPSAYLDDPAFVELALRQLSQVTPEWELKMEYVLGEDAPSGPGSAGRYRFDAPDRIATFARQHGLRFYGHALIWYAQEVPWFRDLDPARFEAEYDRYIATVVGRYAGQAVGWDVVNEAVAEDGDGLRDCLWSQRLGGADAYIARAFHQARAADPHAVLFLNDYNLEALPRKGATFLRLVERLLSAGVPIGGIASQSHLDLDTPDGQIRDFYRSAAQFGLPIHVSELDATQRREGGALDLRTLAYKRERQAALVGELGGAIMELPERQRFALTTWALRDKDSWLRRPPKDDGKDSLVLFDDDGRPTVMFDALVAAVQAKPAA
ncbi:endo-1,4-beta-xylanase [soil metagenome]